MDYQHLQSLIRERVGEEGVARIISLARDGKPVPTVLCLVQQPDGTFSATRGDLRTITRPVSDAAGRDSRFEDEHEACAWAWSDLEPGLGVKPSYTAEEEKEALASGARQRARWEQHLRDWKAASGTAD